MPRRFEFTTMRDAPRLLEPARRLRRVGWLGAGICAGLSLAFAPPLAAQTVRGSVLDASNAQPVPTAGVYLLDRQRHTVGVAMADSLGRWALTVPDSGAYFLVAERFGYRDTESPLLAVSTSRDYTLDLELRPEPLGLGPLTVTVRNDQVVEWLTRELGGNPSAAFGFRLLQGDRLSEAKARGRMNPTETLRWLYIPVSHGLECVSVNVFPRARTVGFRGPREGAFGTPGAPPPATRSMDQIRSEAEEDSGHACGTLLLNDRVIPNEQIDGIDLSSVAVIVALPGSVRMYTYDFDWSFRPR